MKKLAFIFITSLLFASCTICKVTGEIYPTADKATVKTCVECTGNGNDLKGILKIK